MVTSLAIVVTATVLIFLTFPFAGRFQRSAKVESKTIVMNNLKPSPTELLEDKQQQLEINLKLI